MKNTYLKIRTHIHAKLLDGLNFCPERVSESNSISTRNTREENMYTQCFTAD